MPALNDDLAALAHAIVHGGETLPIIEVGSPDYSIAVALEVYRNNYRGNLHDALAGAYPVMVQLVGEDFFRALTRKYIGQHLSHSGNLHDYGAEMADFVAAFEPAKELAYLPDVAALEWACHCAYFADDAAPFDAGPLRAIPPERYPELILHLHPACRLVRSPYPVAAIWHAHQTGAPGDFRIDLNSGPSNTLVSRKDGAVEVSELPDAEALWLQDILDGALLGEATDAAQQPHAGFDLQVALLNLLARDVLTRFSLRAG